MDQTIDQLKEILVRVRAEIGKVIIGQAEVVNKALITIFTGSHALVEGVPGVAKTLLVRTIGRVLGCPSQRIQFTPDLFPADMLAPKVLTFKRKDFTFVKVPVLTLFL